MQALNSGSVEKRLRLHAGQQMSLRELETMGLPLGRHRKGSGTGNSTGTQMFHSWPHRHTTLAVV